MSDTVEYIKDLESRLETLERYSGSGVAIVSSDPVGSDGDLIINRTTDEMKVFYGGTWQVIHSLIDPLKFLLLQNGDFFLLQNGDKMKMQAST